MFENRSFLPAKTRRRVQANPWSISSASSREPRPSESDELFVETFARGLSVIRAFAHRQQALTIGDASRRAGISRAAARRLLHTLVALGYAMVDGNHFTLLPKTLLLGSAFLTSDALVNVGQPIVDRLSKQIDLFCSLHVLQGYESLLVCGAFHEHRDFRQAGPQVGSSAPLYCSASGLMFLSRWADVDVQDYLEHAQLTPFTCRTSCDPRELRHRLQRVRDVGHALIDREMSNEMRSVAVEVRDGAGKVVASLVVIATPEEASVRQLEDLLPTLRTATVELQAQLSHLPGPARYIERHRAGSN